MFVEYITFALEKLKRHRLTADVRYFSSARMLRMLSRAFVTRTLQPEKNKHLI